MVAIVDSFKEVVAKEKIYLFIEAFLVVLSFLLRRVRLQ